MNGVLQSGRMSTHITSALVKLGAFSSSKYTEESRSAEFWTSFERASALILSSLLIWTRSTSANCDR